MNKLLLIALGGLLGTSDGDGTGWKRSRSFTVRLEFRQTAGREIASGPRLLRYNSCMRIRFRFWCVAVLLAFTAPVRGADPVWIQINSLNFVLYTDTTEVKGRRLLEDFEGRLAALGTVLGEIPRRQFPIEVFLFSKKEEFLEGAPRPARVPGIDVPLEFEKSAYLVRGPDRVFVAARDRSPADIADDVGHAIGHVFFARLGVWRPFWLAEGTAEYFRKVGRSPDNKRVSEKDGYPVEDLLEIVRTKAYDDDAPPTPQTTAFRLQSYRLLRLVVARYGTEFRAFLKELGNATEPEPKLRLDPKTLQAEFDAYSETHSVSRTGMFDIKTAALTPEAMAIHRGDLLLGAKKTSEAGVFYNGDKPGSPCLTRDSLPLFAIRRGAHPPSGAGLFGVAKCRPWFIFILAASKRRRRKISNCRPPHWKRPQR